MTDKLAKRTAIKKSEPIDLFKAMAMNIAKNVVAYVDVMYPEAVEATSSTFRLSLRNSIYNEIMAVIKSDPDPDGIEAIIRKDAAFRRWWTAAYREIRKP